MMRVCVCGGEKRINIFFFSFYFLRAPCFYFQPRRNKSMIFSLGGKEEEEEKKSFYR